MASLDDLRTQTSFKDPLSAGGYRFTVHRLPKVSFAVQQVNVPGITLPAVEQRNIFANLPHAGDHIDYGEFRLTYLVDEELKNYLEIHDWIRSLGKPDAFEEYAALHLEPGTGIASDCTLGVLDSKRVLRFTISFKEAVPTSLSDMTFDATLPGISYVRVTATFRYTDFSVTAI